MNSMIEDLPTPIPPTRKMVYGAFALYFDILMTPTPRR
jgi:hypothetical protein